MYAVLANDVLSKGLDFHLRDLDSSAKLCLVLELVHVQNSIRDREGTAWRGSCVGGHFPMRSSKPFAVLARIFVGI